MRPGARVLLLRHAISYGSLLLTQSVVGSLPNNTVTALCVSINVHKGVGNFDAVRDWRGDGDGKRAVGKPLQSPAIARQTAPHAKERMVGPSIVAPTLDGN